MEQGQGFNPDAYHTGDIRLLPLPPADSLRTSRSSCHAGRARSSGPGLMLDCCPDSVVCRGSSDPMTWWCVSIHAAAAHGEYSLCLT